MEKVIALDEVNCLVKARHGWFLANRFDVYLGGALIRYGEFSEIEHRFLRSIIKTGDFVVEAGSNIGAHTVGLAKAVTPAGCVVAVEPQPDIFRVLCANLALNGVSNVTPFAVGCGKTERTMIVPLYDYRAEADHNSGGVALTASGAGVPVAVAPLDELIGAIPRLDLLKVDVEGMEKEALEGAQRLIERYRPVLYVENDRVEKSGDLIEFIRGLGYRLWWHMPPLFNPDNFFGVDSNAYANIVSFNMVCQPKERSTQTFVGLQEIDGSGYHPRSTGRSA